MSIILYLSIVLLYSVSSFRIGSHRLIRNQLCPASKLEDISISEIRFVDWLVANGCNKNELPISLEFSSNEIGSTIACKASRPIRKGDIIFSVPLSLCITATAAAQKFRSSTISTDSLRTGELGILALYLLSEKYLGSKSKYYEYIRILPNEAPGIVTWDVTDIEILKKSTTRRISAQIDAIQSDLFELSRTSISSLPPGSLTKESFLWALCTVKARSLIIDGIRVLAPGIYIYT